MTEDLKFKTPFICIVGGPSGSGRSSFCIRFLQNLDSLCTERHFDGGVIWFYSERTTVPSQQLVVLRKNINFNEGVPENSDNAQGKECLVILDDLFTKGSHHRNITVILITQNLFHQVRYCRDISLNVNISSY